MREVLVSPYATVLVIILFILLKGPVVVLWGRDRVRWNSGHDFIHWNVTNVLCNYRFSFFAYYLFLFPMPELSLSFLPSFCHLSFNLAIAAAITDKRNQRGAVVNDSIRNRLILKTNILSPTLEFSHGIDWKILFLSVTMTSKEVCVDWHCHHTRVLVGRVCVLYNRLARVRPSQLN
jgi:hypothetical protein